MGGHSEPHCFKICKSNDGIVGVWCKDYSSVPQDWLGAEGSRRFPFVLVKPDKYPQTNDYPDVIPDCIPRQFAPEEINRLRAGLEVCHSRMKILDPSDSHYRSCQAVIDRLELAEPQPFHWSVAYMKEDQGAAAAMDEDKKEPAQLPPRSILTSRKRRKGKSEAAVLYRNPEVGDMLVIKADNADDQPNPQRFWLAQLRKIVPSGDETPSEFEILWFQANKEFGKYTFLMQGKGRERKKYVQTIESATVFYSFSALDGGYIPDVHAAGILACVERDGF